MYQKKIYERLPGTWERMPFNLVRHLLHTIFTVELEKLLQTCIERRKYPTLLNISFLRTEKAGWISLVHRVKERFERGRLICRNRHSFSHDCCNLNVTVLMWSAYSPDIVEMHCGEAGMAKLAPT